MPDLLFKDIPQDVIHRAIEYTADFLIGFVRVTDGEHADAELAGSGTLVQIDSAFCILTADHVMERIPRHGKIGLVLLRTGGASQVLGRPIIMTDDLRRVTVGRGDNEREGPDLAVLVLDGVAKELIGATKSFYNVSKRRESVLRSPTKVEHGMWGLSGFPHELVRIEPAQSGFEGVRGFPAILYVTGVENEWSEGDFDYLDIDARSEGARSPITNFQGYSGGGLWQINLAGDSADNVKIKDCILSGVAYYQDFVDGRPHHIRCHGRRSIYQKTIDAVRIAL